MKAFSKLNFFLKAWNNAIFTCSLFEEGKASRNLQIFKSFTSQYTVLREVKHRGICEKWFRGICEKRFITIELRNTLIVLWFPESRKLFINVNQDKWKQVFVKTENNCFAPDRAIRIFQALLCLLKLLKKVAISQFLTTVKRNGSFFQIVVRQILQHGQNTVWHLLCNGIQQLVCLCATKLYFITSQMYNRFRAKVWLFARKQSKWMEWKSCKKGVS